MAGFLQLVFVIFLCFVIGQVLFIGFRYFGDRNKDPITARHYVHILLNSLGAALLAVFVLMDQFEDYGKVDVHLIVGMLGAFLLNLGMVKLWSRGHLNNN